MPIAKILIVNPNTTASMTKTIGDAARAVAAPGTEIVAVTSSMGPVSIEGFYDEAFAVPGLIQALLNAPDADAGIIACFDDTGLDAARSVAPFPVVGICEAALVTAGPTGEAHRGHHDACRARSCRWKNWCAAMALPNARRSPPATSRCSTSKSPAPARKRNSTPRLRARSTRARRPSCSVAPGWPILRQSCRRNSAFPSSTASRPR